MRPAQLARPTVFGWTTHLGTTPLFGTARPRPDASWVIQGMSSPRTKRMIAQTSFARQLPHPSGGRFIPLSVIIRPRLPSREISFLGLLSTRSFLSSREYTTARTKSDKHFDSSKALRNDAGYCLIVQLGDCEIVCGGHAVNHEEDEEIDDGEILRRINALYRETSLS